MISDEKVVQILERKDLTGKEKILLIYILSREPEPRTETVQDPATGKYEKRVVQDHARIPLDQFKEALGKGFTDENRLRRTLKRLHTRKFLDTKRSKGNEPNGYRVRFP